MVTLRPMQNDEYPAYCEILVDEYGKDLAENYGLTVNASIEKARSELTDSLPNGVDTPGHELLCIDLSADSTTDYTQALIGYLWFTTNKEDRTAFILDFFVFDQYRGKGFGKSAVSQLEHRLCALNIKQLKLRVAYSNSRAFKFYQEGGFMITGHNMSKNIGATSH